MKKYCVFATLFHRSLNEKIMNHASVLDNEVEAGEQAAEE